MARSPYFFDKGLAEAAVNFFPRFLCYTTGEWAGRPFHLSDWQAFHTGQIFGWRRRSDGTRRYRSVRGWVPRKNGKTEWFAGIGHLCTIADGEPGAEVYSHALDGKQSAIIYERACRMVALSGPLSEVYEVSKTGMICTALMNACFRPLSGEAYGKHGLFPHAAIGDEAHVWKNGKLHTFLIDGMSARRQPLDMTISTAGEIKTYGHELYIESLAALGKEDSETYTFIYAAGAEDDWTDPEVWAKANPNLNISVKLERIAAACERARQSPRLENDFKRYYLNLWVEQARRWFPMHRWADNTAHPQDKDHWKALPGLMKGRPCFGGIDLGSTDDLSCVVWVFPPIEPDGRVVLVPRFYMPEDNVAERDKPQHPYKTWCSEGCGAIQTTPGNVTDYDFIEHDVMADAERYHVQKVAIDKLFQGVQVAVHLQSEGLPVELFGQGFYSMAGPSKDFERLFIAGKFEHGNHPVLEWMFRNATYAKDPAGNIKPDKARASDKIDGVVGGIMGVGCMTAHNPEPSGSYLDHDDILVL